MTEMTVNQGPFIGVREVLSSTPWGDWVKERMPMELRRRYFIPFWTEARLRRHLEMLKAFGFNSIQVGANPCVAWWVGADYDVFRQRQLFLCRTAHELRMSVSIGVWGAAVADATKSGQQFTELDWHTPDGRSRLEAWYRDQAVLAQYASRVVTHWVDPGQPQQGGLDTVIEMHNFILDIYREKNPGIRGALSTWFMNGHAGYIYPGYQGPGKLAADPKLDRDTDVVIGLMNYHADGVDPDIDGELMAADLDGIAAANRQAGVWGWYTADNEINPALHVRIGVLQQYFRNLPQETRTKLAWHSIDDTFPGLNMQNLYVAGKLMQDPSLDAGALLTEFVRGFVGEVNTPAVTSALLGVEQARTRSLLYNVKIEDAVAPKSDAKDDRKPLPATWLDETATTVDAAIVELNAVKVDPDFKTAWPVTMEPAEYLAELQAHLEAIRQMLAFLKGVREVERLQAGGAPAGTLESAINNLPGVEYDTAHTAGLEEQVYQQKLAALKKGVQPS